LNSPKGHDYDAQLFDRRTRGRRRPGAACEESEEQFTDAAGQTCGFVPDAFKNKSYQFELFTLETNVRSHITDGSKILGTDRQSAPSDEAGSA
jgi:hypothetical protein